MNRVTSVLMGRDTGRRKLSGDEAAKKRSLKRVRESAEAVRKHDAGGDALRKERNDSIVDAAKHAPATEIAEVAGIKQSYVSRVIRSSGEPPSGSDLDRSRDKEGADA